MDQIKVYIYTILKKTVKKLYESDIDIFFSGTTLNMVYIINNSLFICNVGDSRSIIG